MTDDEKKDEVNDIFGPDEVINKDDK